MPSIFSKIISKEIPSYTIYENEKVIVFLDITPFSRGHCLVVPKIEVDNFVNLDDEYYYELFKVAKELSPNLTKSLGCQRVGLMIEGREVPHVHLHLIPLYKGKEMVGQRIDTDHDELKSLHSFLLENL